MAAPRAQPVAPFPAKRLLLGGTSAWYVPAHFEPIKKVSMATHTEVVAFKNRESGNVVWVKKVKDALRNIGDAQRLLREVKVLRSAQHENLLAGVDVYAPSSLNDVYVVTPAMKSSLQKVMCSRQELTLEHRQSLMHQMTRGLFYLHSAGLVHRDLRPSNILVNADCSIKICNFGLMRNREEEDGVVASEYRAPEQLLGSRYTSAVDIWATGCILAQLAAGRPVFGGRDNLDQIRRILLVLGPSPKENIDWIPIRGRELLRVNERAGQPVLWADRIPGSPEQELNAIESMLAFAPQRRPTALHMLRHPYLQSLYTVADEVKSESTFDWSFDRYALSDDEIRGCFRDECRIFQHSQASPDTQILTPEQQGPRLGIITPSSRYSEKLVSPRSYSQLSSPSCRGLSPAPSPSFHTGVCRQASETERSCVRESTTSEVEEMNSAKKFAKLGAASTLSRHRLGSG